MEKDINTEVSNTQLPATEEKANLKESLRIQKSQWIKEQIKRQREAEDAVLEQMIEEQRVIDGLNSDINENLDRTRESRKFNQEFQAHPIPSALHLRHYSYHYHLVQRSR